MLFQILSIGQRQGGQREFCQIQVIVAAAAAVVVAIGS